MAGWQRAHEYSSSIWSTKTEQFSLGHWHIVLNSEYEFQSLSTLSNTCIPIHKCQILWISVKIEPYGSHRKLSQAGCVFHLISPSVISEA